MADQVWAGAASLALAGLSPRFNIQTGEQAQNSAKLRILFVASERFIEPVPPHPGNLSELFDVLRLHDGLDRIQNAAELAFPKRLSQVLGNRYWIIA